MDVANMLSHDPPRTHRSHQSADHLASEPQRSHQYPTRQSLMSNALQQDSHSAHAANSVGVDSLSSGSREDYSLPSSPAPPKNVAFELLFDDRSTYRARLPMRVQIFPHDTTDSIVTTVKNFYGLYEGTAKGVSFEDEQGHTLIARYENFRNDMVVYVRVIPDFAQNWQASEPNSNHAPTPTSAQRTPHLDVGFEMPPPQPAQISTFGQPLSRPPSRLARKQSASPGIGGNRRSTSVQKTRSRATWKGREEIIQSHSDDHNIDGFKDYSSSDGEAGSVTSSRKARNEQLASAEISLENIVEGGRRQRAKFESSELPLFVPPQVPATNSISSISPQRRSNGQENPSPFARPPQRPLNYTHPLQSPQSYGIADSPYKASPTDGVASKAQAELHHTHRLRDRVSAPGPLTRLSNGGQTRPQGPGILPTPDPTIASCISDEDVALQLMRLGDASNFSTHGRTSASTLDDTLSGRADIASSASDDSNGEESEDEKADQQEILATFAANTMQKIKSKFQPRQQNLNSANTDSAEASGDDDDEYEDEETKQSHPAKRTKLSTFKNSSGQSSKGRTPLAVKKNGKVSKTQPQTISKKAKPLLQQSASKTAMSPPSMIPLSRKSSSATLSAGQNQSIAPDDDLSTKPRCQRCRKSKKGCDRQRPCQRCKDAGIGIEGCISEDEGNGRKGRFGRHMGVSVKKEQPDPVLSPDTEEVDSTLDGMQMVQDKGKKRKRV